MSKNYIKDIRLAPYLEGLERRQELAEDIIKKGTHLPRGVLLEDIDKSVIEFVNKKLSITIDGEKVPVVFLTTQRWSEFSQTWEFTDEFKNVKFPFITLVREPDVQVGTNQNSLWNIPGHKSYTYLKLPTWNGNRIGMTLYKIPQPTSVDVNYELRFFSTKMRDLNKFTVNIQKVFNARQSYVFPNNHPQPLHLEDIGDESTVDDFENRRFYLQNFSLLLKGYILDEKDFKTTPAIDRTIQITDMAPTHSSVQSSTIKYTKKSGEGVYTIIEPKNTDNKITFKIKDPINFNIFDGMRNASLDKIYYNTNEVTLPFSAGTGNNITIIINKNNKKSSKFILKGWLI